MRKKRMVLLMTGVLFCSSIFTGCGNKNESEVKGEGGKDKITVAVYDRGNLNPDEGTIDDNRWTKWINENAPVEVEFIPIPRNSSADKYSTLLASNSAPDLILEYEAGILGGMISNGSLMPIDDLVEQYSTEYKALMEKYPAMKKRGTVDGELYYLTSVRTLATNHVIYIRTDWLNKLGLKMPTTTAELYEVAEAFAKQDPDGNGVDDTYGFSFGQMGRLQIGYMFGTDIVLDGTEYVYPWDRMVAATQYKKDMFDNGIVNKDYAADTAGEQEKQDFISGKLGIIAGNVSTGYESVIENFHQNNPDGELAVLPLPASEFGHFNTATGGGVSVVGAVNANCKNPEAVMKYIDWICNNEEVFSTLVYGGEEYSQRNERGIWIPKDEDVFSKEVYGADFTMLTSTIGFEGEGVNPFEEGTEMYDYYEQAQAAYFGYDGAYSKNVAGPFQVAPVLPSDLSLIYSNTYGSSVMSDNWEKAVVSGSAYTVEQALEDNKKLVEDGNGEKVLEYYKEWYKNAAADGLMMTEEDCEVMRPKQQE